MKARPILFPILAGLFTGTSYIPFPPWAILFCFAPLLVVWFETARAADPASYRQTIKTVFFYGWLTQFILNLIGFHWIAYTAVEFGHFPIWAGTLVLLAFAALAHLYIPLSGVIATALIFALKKRGRANALQQPWLFIAAATAGSQGQSQGDRQGQGCQPLWANGAHVHGQFSSGRRCPRG